MATATCIPKETQKDTHPFGDGAKREKVYEGNHCSLYKYYTKHESPCMIPVCISYALVNKTYILDLSPAKSFIRPLIENGLILYMLEWDDPGKTLINPTIDEYIDDDIHGAIEYIKKTHNIPKVNLLGICQGGTFSLMYSALHPENIQNLVTIVTPADFQKTENIFSHMAQYWDTSAVTDAWKSIPGDFMNMGFLQLKPFELMIGKYIGIEKVMNDPNKKDMFMRMEKWIFDSPNQSGVAWKKFIHHCYQENNLVKKKFPIGKRFVELTNIKCPILNIAAEKDHLVPNSATKAIETYTDSNDYTYASYPTGHIGIFISSLARKKIGPQIAKWLSERQK